ncbi:hypothetical protein VNI00_012269 [Paramarasmius palmivorus]|uniref:3-oxoacyl-[acyl-carrier-protein] reductase n=1 Tax=Paramarasmius palmivorus TaxID=297713 RepID=A0AAW0C6X0_9AGAR
MLRRVALITGAAQGIGKAIALRLANEGFDIAINDIRAKSGQLGSVAETIMGLGRRVDVVPADVSVEKDVQGMIGETVEKLGSLDVVSVVDPSRTYSSHMPDGGKRRDCHGGIGDIQLVHVL